MSGDAWITLLVVIVAIVVMIRDLVAPATAVLGATVLLFLGGVITTAEAFSGFSNEATLTIAVLYVLAKAASKTGAIQPLVSRALDGGSGERRNLLRLLPPVAGASSVLNNTPIVAMLVPEISAWAARHGKAVSRFLMPVSFGAILGGTLTLIGTATNLVVSGLLDSVGLEPLGFFELTPLGVPIVLCGLGVLIAAAPTLLPAVEKDSRTELTELVREFVVDVSVTEQGPLDGVTVENGGLRHLAGVFLVQMERNGEPFAPVAPTTLLHGGDRLRFVGKADDVVDLLAIPGLQSGEDDVVGFDLDRSSFFEAVVGFSSPLVGATLRESRFRSGYQAAVVAIHRAGQRIDAKLGDVRLRVGDTLVVLSDRGWWERWRDRRDFLLVSPLNVSPPQASGHRRTVAAILAAVVVIAAATPATIFQAALGGALALIALRIVTPGEARDAVDLDVVLLIAGGFGLGAAMRTSGLADVLADGIVNTLGTIGPVGALAGIAIATMVLTESISNAAAALITFPIAIATAQGLELDPRSFAIAVAFAASAAFLTPVGYQTNVMVYGPGGYRYGDYARMGLPLTATVLTAIVIGVPLLWPL